MGRVKVQEVDKNSSDLKSDVGPEREEDSGAKSRQFRLDLMNEQKYWDPRDLAFVRKDKNGGSGERAGLCTLWLSSFKSIPATT